MSIDDGSGNVDPASVTIDLSSEYRIKYVVLDTSQDDGLEDEGLGYYVSIEDSNGTVSVCGSETYSYTNGVQSNHEAVDCSDDSNYDTYNGIVGHTIVISKSSGTLTIHGVAILISECFSCDQQTIVQ